MTKDQRIWKVRQQLRFIHHFYTHLDYESLKAMAGRGSVIFREIEREFCDILTHHNGVVLPIVVLVIT